jgi:hypothetical protein
MTDMKKTIGFWRKPRDNMIDEPLIKITLNLGSQKIAAKFCIHGPDLSTRREFIK